MIRPWHIVWGNTVITSQRHNKIRNSQKFFSCSPQFPFSLFPTLITVESPGRNASFGGQTRDSSNYTIGPRCCHKPNVKIWRRNSENSLSQSTFWTPSGHLRASQEGDAMSTCKCNVFGRNLLPDSLNLCCQTSLPWLIIVSKDVWFHSKVHEFICLPSI